MKKLLLVWCCCIANAWAAPVNINTDDAAAIAAALDNVGLKKAEAIVKYRQAHGPFKSPDELEKVAGIGAKTLLKIKADVLVNDPGKGTDTPTASTETKAK
ncbi:MAG: helix-hairpin-helix domain-containing protein [Hydrogenophaga sp.]|uniref:ComEA family DNA-binding protein n=1 Tax=Methylicorpusculum sp. TaxID=2713644 RepID=UPI00275A4A4D|nr:helix-hairpin-helix domain-containing protein [Methylicorpusculum sp.]MDP3323092.1 helix-hairpin-helix domain-containing protein [Hydrogenophaga sp.]MDZ4154873.1 helix-hairpin-helix domain-containing protein [Methylicorpusculum sp.]